MTCECKVKLESKDKSTQISGGLDFLIALSCLLLNIRARPSITSTLPYVKCEVPYATNLFIIHVQHERRQSIIHFTSYSQLVWTNQRRYTL